MANTDWTDRKCIEFGAEPEYLDETVKLARERGCTTVHTGKIDLRILGPSAVIEALISDLGFDHEDLADGTVSYIEPVENPYIEELTYDDPDNELYRMQQMLKAMQSRLDYHVRTCQIERFVPDLQTALNQAVELNGTIDKLYSWKPLK